MILEIVCKSCREGFGIGGNRISGNIVQVPFKCPNCGADYLVGEPVRLAGATGGVSIKGSTTIYGDVVGRDKH